MKKDNQLERAFDEYFEGAAAPKASVTDGAKNSMKPRRTISASFKRALIAAAGVLSACASAVGLYFTPNVIGGIIDRGDNGYIDGSGTGEPNSPADTGFKFYDFALLTETEADVYASGNPSGLEFIKNFDLATNCSLDSFTAYTLNGETALYKAEISATVQACRHDAVIYAEYTPDNSACELFEDYYSGDYDYYRGHAFTHKQTYENGEYVNNVYIKADGVKYYLSVKSSDKNAFLGYLETILK